MRLTRILSIYKFPTLRTVLCPSTCIYDYLKRYGHFEPSNRLILRIEELNLR